MAVCRRCLLEELGDEELYQRIRRTIDAIPDAQRCAPDEYRRRLEACRGCDRLLGGVCRVCGCFVEVRAAKEKEHCPGAGKSFW